MDKKQFEKCKGDPRYWYNTYFLKESDPKLSQEEWENRMRLIEQQVNLVRGRKVHVQYPARIDECFKYDEAGNQIY